MAVNDVAAVRVVGTHQGNAINVVLHFAYKSVAATLAGLLVDLESSIQLRDALISDQSSAMSYTELQGQQLIPFGAASLAEPISPTWTGTGVGEAMAGQDAMVVTKRSALIGRARRGRVYVAGGLESHHSGGSWLAATVSAKQTLWNAVLAKWSPGGTSADYALVVWSREIAGPTPPYDPTAWTPVTSLLVRSQVRAQRRRQVGVGA